MKNITFLLALALTGTATFAQNFSMTSLTPPLSFPKDNTEGESVSKDRIMVGN